MKMFKRVLSLTLVGAVCLALVKDSNAAIYTEEATLGTDTGAATDVEVFTFDSSGRIFTNQKGGAVPGTGTVLTIGSNLFIDYATDPAAPFPPTTADLSDGGARVIAIFAVKGTVTGGTVTFNDGAVWLFRNSTGYAGNNPSSWGDGFADGDPTNGGSFQIARFDLKPQEDVISSGTAGEEISQAGFNGFIPAAQTNSVSLNIIDRIFTTGALLFEETTDPTDFFTVTTNSSGTSSFNDSFVSLVSQAFLNETLIWDAADKAILNFFANAAVGEDFSTFSGLGQAVDPADYEPNSNFTTGDFIATVDTNNYPGSQVVVPEPSSLVLYGFGSILFGLVGYVRRNRLSRGA